MITLLLVGVGAVGGAWSRYLLGELLDADGLDTLVVNLLGSFTLGVVLGLSPPQSLFWIVGTGFCGAFTTFSSFAVETVEFLQTGERRLAVIYAAGNLVGAVTAVLLGARVAGLV